MLQRLKTMFGFQDQPSNRQLLGRFDTIERRANFFQSIINNILENPDQILARYAPGEGLDLYRKMEGSDPVVASALNTRRSAVVNRGWSLLDGQADPRIAEYAAELVAGIDNLRETLEQALGALVTGFVPIEIVWTVKSNQWYIEKLVARDPANYCFDAQNRLRLLTVNNPVEGEPVPPLKFIVHRYRGSEANPYGESVLKSLYWPVTFSRAGWKWWATAIEKYGMPIITASFPDAASSEDRARFEEFVKTLQAYSWSVVPEGFMVELHEARRATGDDYLPFLQYADTKKFQVILGQNLTAEVADRGSRAQAQIHNEVRHDITLADATNLAETINRQLIKPAIALNFNYAGPLPRFTIPTHPPYDPVKLAQTYAILAKHVTISERFLRQVFQITD
jgi:phage gp29-like protein